MIRSGTVPLLKLLALAVLTELNLKADPTNQLSEFHEIYGIIRENLPGTKPQELDHAAALGLVAALGSQVVLITNNLGPTPDGPDAGPLLLRSNLFDGQIAYARIGRVGEGLDTSIRQACREFAKTNKLKGVVLDLRYAQGENYPAAAAVADLFVTREQTLLNWASGEYRSKSSEDDINLPVVALVNHETKGAAEALAGVIRQAGVGLVLGSRTAGQAMVAQDFPLKNGDRLRIATARIVLGDGTALSPQGLVPDIAVELNPADERAYYADAFKVTTKPESTASATAAVAGGAGTNRAARRALLNEAELVRERREAASLEERLPSEKEPEVEKPVVRDPVLARALDVLKGLALVRQSRS